MTFSVGDKVIIGVNGYDWDTRLEQFVFEGASATVAKVYTEHDPNVIDVILDDRALHKNLGGEDIDGEAWPFYENELIRAARTPRWGSAPPPGYRRSEVLPVLGRLLHRHSDHGMRLHPGLRLPEKGERGSADSLGSACFTQTRTCL